MRSKFSLTLDDVHKIVAACRREADRVARAATIAVVDGSRCAHVPGAAGRSAREQRGHGHREGANRSFSRTSELESRARVKERPGFLTYPNAIAVTGGVPLFYEGQCVGGVGVSGVADGDEVVAKAGAEALT